MTPPPKGNYLEALFHFVANLKINKYMRSHKNGWGNDFLGGTRNFIGGSPITITGQ